MGIWTVSTSWLLWTKLLHLCKFWGEPVCNSWVATWEWNCSVLWLLCLTFWGMLDSFLRDSTPSFLYLVSHSSVCWSALEGKNNCIAYHTLVQFSESWIVFQVAGAMSPPLGSPHDPLGWPRGLLDSPTSALPTVWCVGRGWLCLNSLPSLPECEHFYVCVWHLLGVFLLMWAELFALSSAGMSVHLTTNVLALKHKVQKENCKIRIHEWVINGNQAPSCQLAHGM